VFLVHGLGGHGGQFERLATDLNHRGYEVLAPDLPGHGLSPGERGWIRQWADLRNALAGVVEPLLSRPSSPPSFLFGHSLGGALVVDLLLDRQNGAHPLPIAGAILCNPAIASDGIQRWRLLLARLFSRFHPHFSLDPGFALETASRDPVVLSAYAADPLHHHRATARLACEFLAATERIRRQAPELRTPVLLLQSGADQVTPPGPARRFFETLGSEDKRWRLYPESYHHLHDDLDRELMLADLVQWLQAHGG
jgi:alpha-beta hydrolase superfamily lysophospholipase